MQNTRQRILDYLDNNYQSTALELVGNKTDISAAVFCGDFLILSKSGWNIDAFILKGFYRKFPISQGDCPFN